MEPNENERAVYTIGHSTRPLEEFVSMLTAHAIDKLIDIRTVPRSAMNPQFNRESLPEDLAKAGIQYEHLAGLGGLRKTRPDSVNTGWKNASFRGYADYMQTPAFANALEQLIREARDERVCIMCAEAVPWRCHRNLVADALTAKGITVKHIMNASRAQPDGIQRHRLAKFARVREGHVTYPAESLDFGEPGNSPVDD
jgi:uncharacterized protein (DUF488 family)